MIKWVYKYGFMAALIATTANPFCGPPSVTSCHANEVILRNQSFIKFSPKGFIQDRLLSPRQEFSPFIKWVYFDNTLFQNEALIAEMKQNQKRVVDIYFESLTLNILKEKTTLLTETKPYPDNESPYWDDEPVKREIALRASWQAAGNTLRQTDVGKKFDTYFNRFNRFFMIEFSKTIYQNRPHFYLPGQMPSTNTDIKKDFNITLTSLFYPGNGSNAQTAFELKVLYRNVLSKTTYDFGDQSFAFDFINQGLNSYLGVDVGLMIMHQDTDNVSGLLSMTVKF